MVNHDQSWRAGHANAGQRYVRETWSGRLILQTGDRAAASAAHWPRGRRPRVRDRRGNRVRPDTSGAHRHPYRIGIPHPPATDDFSERYERFRAERPDDLTLPQDECGHGLGLTNPWCDSLVRGRILRRDHLSLASLTAVRTRFLGVARRRRTCRRCHLHR